MNKKLGFLFLALLTLAGCDTDDVYNKMLTKFSSEYSNEVNLSKQYLAMTEAHDFTTIQTKIDPRLKNDQLLAGLEKTASFFPAGTPTDVKLIGIDRNEFSNGEQNIITTKVDFEYNFSGKWLQAGVVLQEQNHNILIAGIHVIPLPDSLENMFKFTWHGKSPINYIFLAATCIIPLFILVTLIVCIRTPIPKRKWLWVIFVLFGFISFSLNWSDGQITVNPFHGSLMGAGFSDMGPYSPVILQLSLPVGAVIFLFKRKKWVTASGRQTN